MAPKGQIPFYFLLNFLLLFSKFLFFKQRVYCFKKRKEKFRLFLFKFLFSFFSNNRPTVLKSESWTIRKERNLTLWSHHTQDFFSSLLFIFACFASLSVHISYFKSFWRHSIVSNSPTWFIKSNGFEFEPSVIRT